MPVTSRLVRLVAVIAILASGAPTTASAGSFALLAPPDHARLTLPAPERFTTVLTWDPVPGVAGYRVLVGTSPGLETPLVDRRVDATSTSIRGLAEGGYHWRVEALATDAALVAAAEARFSIERSPGR